MENKDVYTLYEAFTNLCSFIEKKVGCKNCPMWDKVCHAQKQKQEEFVMLLKRIKEDRTINQESK